MYQTEGFSGKVSLYVQPYNNIAELSPTGGYVPRDSPVLVITESSLIEYIIVGVVSSVGILSTIFFFTFNLYYRKHP